MLGVRSEVAIAGTRDDRIAQVARRQRGRIARRQLLAIGIPHSSVRWLAAHGRLFALLHCVFAVGHPTPTELGDETTALLAAGDDAALTGISATMLWGLLNPGDGDGLVHVVVPGRKGRMLPGVRIHQTRHLPPTDVRIHRGLPVLSPARALLESAELITERRLELAIDRAVVDGLLRPGALAEVAARTPGRHAATLIKDQLARLTDEPAVTLSQAEERFLALIRQAELPPPRVNRRLHGFQIDFYWPQHKVAVEIDGFRFHSSRRAFEHDRRKDAMLQAAGIRVLRFTWRQLLEEPLAVVARLAALLARAA